jgi:pyruvate formate lyase activating enzyme
MGEGQVGFCGVRGNVSGKLQLFVYGKIIAGHIDPIEKKPVTHYMPGTKIFSIATTGCSWACQYCFTPDTFVFTNRGVKTFEQLYSEGRNEHTHGLNGEKDLTEVTALTHRGRFKPVRQVFRHFYGGPMLKIKPWYLPPIKCTPDHKILTTSNPRRRPKKVQARFITKKNYLAIPKIRESQASTIVDLAAFLSTLKLSAYKVRTSNQWRLDYATLSKIAQLIAAGFTSKAIARELHLRYATVRGARFKLARHSPSELSQRSAPCRVIVSKGKVRLSNSKTAVPRFIRVNEDFAKILGYFCADGSTSKQEDRPNSFTLSFSFGVSEKSNVDEVQRLIKQVFDLDSYIVTQGTTVHVALSNTILGLLFRELCGIDSYSKHVPDMILTSANRRVIRGFLDGYLAGDGYVTRANHGDSRSYVGANSVSRDLSWGVALLFIKIGSVPRLYISENNPVSSFQGRTISRHDDYMLKVLKRNDASRESALDWEDIKGLVVEQKDRYLVPVRSISTEDYSGFVYNMEVDEDHTYVANTIAVSNCQNFDISQRRKVEGLDATPESVVAMTKRYRCEGLAYTYNEPSIFIEFAHDIGVQARKAGLVNIFVSNGYDTPDSVGLMKDFLDCITVDFKGNGETGFVRKYITIANADPVFQTLLELRDKTQVHIEITDLIVPEVGDDLGAAKKLSSWIYDNLGPDTPIHFLRFHPDYKMTNLPPTPTKTLEKHHKVAKEVGLNYVYIGNVPGHPLEHTYCPECGAIAVERMGFDITGWNLDARNCCKSCGNEIPIVGKLSASINEERFVPVIM